MKRGGFKREFGTGGFVKDYLRENGPSHIYAIWVAFRNLCEKKGYTPATYDNFRSYFWHLKKHGLVEKHHKEKTSWGEDRIYYRLNPNKLDDPAWVNPRRRL